MYNNKIVKTNKPFIFSKKLSDNNKIIYLNRVTNTSGPMRYFPPTNQEWSNSIYVYNNHVIKNMSIAQKNLTKLINSYFNFYFGNNLISTNRVLTRFRRLAINKIFISKAELKHTNNKVIITLYAYNEERRILINKIRRIETILFPSYDFVSEQLKKDIYLVLDLRKRLNLIKKDNVLSFINLLGKIEKNIVEEIKLEKKTLEVINKLNSKKEKLLLIKDLEENLNKVLNITYSCLNNPISLKHYENIYTKFLNKTILEKEITTLTYYKLLLDLNTFKLEDLFISRLSLLVSKIYNKEVEFNIVNLKAIYLNSDILTQAIALKLKDRNNKILKVLRSFLYMVKLPKVNQLKERFAHIKIKNLWTNRVKNLTINSLALNFNRDKINDLLISLFINNDFTSNLLINRSNKDDKYEKNLFDSKTSLLNNVLLLLKYKSMAGVRLEAKGRLTRRFTASRSVFKIKWKGSLKNIDSSYKGLSSVILKGHVKSNVQYSLIKSKTRNGAFGLKGWISGK